MNPGRELSPGGEGAGVWWLTERYEALRGEALTRGPSEPKGEGARGPGVLAARGMAEWARVSTACAPPCSPASGKGEASGACLGLPAPWAGSEELVRVLAGWVWTLQKEGRA